MLFYKCDICGEAQDVNVVVPATNYNPLGQTYKLKIPWSLRDEVDVSGRKYEDCCYTCNEKFQDIITKENDICNELIKKRLIEEVSEIQKLEETCND